MIACSCHGTAKKLYAGVTGPEMLKNKAFFEELDPLEQRMTQLRQILQEQNPTLDLDVFSLHDPFGPTVEGADIEVIFVSEETRPFTEEKINGARKERGLPLLDIISVPLLLPPNNFSSNGAKLSSTQLRKRVWEAKRLSEDNKRSI